MLTNLAKITLGGRMLLHFTSLNLERFAQVVQENKIWMSSTLTVRAYLCQTRPMQYNWHLASSTRQSTRTRGK
jgi:hypothetical protein